MSNIDRRLDKLETLYQRPAEPTGPPCDPSRLTAGEQAELQYLTEVLAAVDVGPIPLDHRSDIRRRLDVLTDDQLATLERLQHTACGAPAATEATDADMD